MILIGNMRLPDLDCVVYRGYTLNFYYDQAGQICLDLGDKHYEFGMDNANYREDAKLIVNELLDTIARFPNFPGSKLEWFANGNFRDVRLMYKGRVAKVYLVGIPLESKSLSDLSEDAVRVLKHMAESGQYDQ